MSFVGLNSLSKKIRDQILYNTSTELAFIPINQKVTLQESVKSSISIIPSYISALEFAIKSNATGIVNGFSDPSSINFYLNMLNTIDNIILLNFKYNTTKANIVEETEQYNSSYNVTKTNNIELDIALVYYSIQYPLDTIIDPVKLNAVKALLAQMFS